MKKLVILIFVCCLGFTSISQNKFDIKPLPRIEFEDFMRQQQPDYFTISTQLKLETQTPQYSFFNNNKDSTADNISFPSKADVFMALGDNMPVAQPSGNYWNMPVSVPDSSNIYFIQEKRIEGDPWE